LSRTRGSQAVGLLTCLGAAALIGSEFLTWSHQLGPAERRILHGAVLFGVPTKPDAWQVYAIAGEVLAALAIGVVAAGLWGQRRVRALALAAVILGLIFVIRAAGTPPTNGLLLVAGGGDARQYLTDPATPGPGETVAIVGLALCAVGLVLGVVRRPTPR
jgi:hypothetical protein